MENFFSLLFDDRVRCREIVILWFAECPVEGKTLNEVLRNIINTILYAQLDIVLDINTITFFKGNNRFSLIYENLKLVEKKQILEIYINKQNIFDTCESTTWNLSACKTKNLFSQNRRRRVVRECIFLLLSIRGCVIVVKNTIISVTQSIIEKEHRRDDVFIRNLHDKLQGIGNINELIATD